MTSQAPAATTSERPIGLVLAALATVVLGYLWGALQTRDAFDLGLVIFAVTAVILVASTRMSEGAQRIIPAIVLIAALVGTIIVGVAWAVPQH